MNIISDQKLFFIAVSQLYPAPRKGGVCFLASALPVEFLCYEYYNDEVYGLSCY